ncbi:MAG: hypothetical protein ACRD8O_24290 [Bryobacteraceae bacterium]
MSSPVYSAPADLIADINRVERRSLIVGAAAAALCVIGLFVNADQFFRSYLTAFVFWNGVALGSMAITMLHHMTGGAWGLVIRRILEAATRTFPITLLLFLPLLGGLPRLYHWVHPGDDRILQEKTAYLNVPFFLVRVGIYFAAWLALAWRLNKWSLDQDRAGAEPAHTRLQLLSGGGLLVYGATVTFASIDWVMSLDPHWFSTIFGILFMGGQGVSALAFVITVITVVGRRGPLVDVITSRHLHDLGKLLFAFNMLWAYFAFSQYLITWSANLPEEIPWYIRRTTGGWQALASAILVLHFVLPFAVLLSRAAKENLQLLSAIAWLIIVMRIADIFWMVAPNFHQGLAIHWLDVAAPVAVGGLWGAAFFNQLKRRPLLPVHDPMIEEALEHGR